MDLWWCTIHTLTLLLTPLWNGRIRAFWLPGRLSINKYTRRILASLHQNTHVEEPPHVWGFGIHDKDIRDLFCWTIGLSSIYIFLTAVSDLKVPDALHKHFPILCVYFESTPIAVVSNWQCRALFEALQTNTNLERLTVYHNRITFGEHDEAGNGVMAAFYFELLTTNTTLKSLNIQRIILTRCPWTL